MCGGVRGGSRVELRGAREATRVGPGQPVSPSLAPILGTAWGGRQHVRGTQTGGEGGGTREWASASPSGEARYQSSAIRIVLIQRGASFMRRGAWLSVRPGPSY